MLAGAALLIATHAGHRHRSGHRSEHRSGKNIDIAIGKEQDVYKKLNKFRHTYGIINRTLKNSFRKNKNKIL